MSRKKLTVASAFGPVVAVLAVLSMGQLAPNPPGFGNPLPGVTAAEQARFSAGKTSFASAEAVSDGLGPVFNENACAVCHFFGATGGGSARLETRFGRTVNGVFDPLDGTGPSRLALGGSLMQDHGIGGPYCCDANGNPVTFVAEVVPPQANTMTKRRTTPLFGLGLVDNVPDQTFIELQERTGGRANMVLDVATNQTKVGRFGWKCQQASLFAFSGDAYLNEMGITTPRFPASGMGFFNENCPQGNCALLAANPGPSHPPDGTNDPDLSSLVAFTDFMTFLGAPPRGAITDQVQQGAFLFRVIGCAQCHTPFLTTGPNASAALNQVTFSPFSDFLLHDMGSLNDGIAQAGAGTNEMRTAPLWGVRLQTVLLHDGSATTIRQAILRHDGEGRAARNAFINLDDTQKGALLAFLKSL